MKAQQLLGATVATLGLVILPMSGASAAVPSDETPTTSRAKVTTATVPLSDAQCDMVRSKKPNDPCVEIVTTGESPAVAVNDKAKSAAAAAVTYCKNIWQTRSDKNGGQVWKFRHEAEVCWDGKKATVKSQNCRAEYTIFAYDIEKCRKDAQSGGAVKLTNIFKQYLKTDIWEPSATWTQTMTVSKSGGVTYWNN